MGNFTEYYQKLNELDWITVPEWVFFSSEPDQQFMQERHASNEVNMWEDSYVIAPVGHRGSGKTTLASALAIQGKWLWPDLRIISNFPIKWQVKNSKGKINKYQAEPLDLVRMVQFDDDYQHALILLDECPAILNRMNAASNKNKILNLYIQQLRKNRNSLVLCSQDFKLIDYEAQYQTDIIAYCKDASRRYPATGLKRGGVILIDLADNSGQWTGYTMNERPKFYKMKMLSEYIWGTFDSHYTIDIIDQLWRLEIQRETYSTGRDKEVDTQYLETVAEVLQSAADAGYPSVSCEDVYASAGIVTQAEKTEVGKRLGAIACGRSRVDNVWHYPLTSYDKNKFLENSQNCLEKA